SKGDGLISLDQYVERIPASQSQIYYAVGPSKAMLAHSPQLEGLKQRGYEVLFMTDGVDQWAVEGLEEYEGKKLVNAMEADLQLDATDESKAEGGEEAKEKEAGDLAPLFERVKEILSEHVSEVRASSRLTDSPICLVLPKGGLPAHLERLIRAQ